MAQNHPFQKTLAGLNKLIETLESNIGGKCTASSKQNVPEEHKIEKPIQEENKTETKEKNEKKEKKDSKNNKDNKEKKPKEPSKPSTKKEEAPTNNESPKDLLSLFDIRVGRIIDCWKHPNSEKLYCEKIDLGYEIREIASGVQKEIPIEEMKGLVIIAANLKARKLGGFPSNGMVLMASNSDHSIIELLRPDENTPLGERVIIDGLENIADRKEKELNPKQNILEKCLAVMKTDNNGLATFAGNLLKTSKGVIKSQTLKDANIS